MQTAMYRIYVYGTNACNMFALIYSFVAAQSNISAQKDGHGFSPGQYCSPDPATTKTGIVAARNELHRYTKQGIVFSPEPPMLSGSGFQSPALAPLLRTKERRLRRCRPRGIPRRLPFRSLQVPSHAASIRGRSCYCLTVAGELKT